MFRYLSLMILAIGALGFMADTAEAARVRVVVRRPRAAVVVKQRAAVVRVRAARVRVVAPAVRVRVRVR